MIREQLTPDEQHRYDRLAAEFGDARRRRWACCDRRRCYADKPTATRAGPPVGARQSGAAGEVIAAGGVASVKMAGGRVRFRAAGGCAGGRSVASVWPSGSPIRRNPLFARVIVNRLWHYHFGVGLVDTPNDFGFNGGRPSNPELLDWLAATLVEQKFSLKTMHRVIVNSATYRQAIDATTRPRPQSMPTIGCCGASRPRGWRPKRCATRCWHVAGVLDLAPRRAGLSGNDGSRSLRARTRFSIWTTTPRVTSSSGARCIASGPERPQPIAGCVRLSRSLDHLAQAGRDDHAAAGPGAA